MYQYSAANVRRRTYFFVAFSGWATVGAPFLSIESGKAFFEAEILSAEGEVFVGITGTNVRWGESGFTKALGQTEASWSILSVNGEAYNRFKANVFICWRMISGAHVRDEYHVVQKGQSH